MYQYTEEEFDVTREDIDEGVPEDPKKCAIARAAQRHFGKDAWMDRYLGIDMKVYHVDKNLDAWIYQFDYDKTVLEQITVVLYREDQRRCAGIKGEDI